MERIESLMWLWLLGYFAIYYATPMLRVFIIDNENPNCKSLPRQFHPKYAYFSFNYGYGLVTLCLFARNILALLFLMAVAHSMDFDII